MLSKILVSLVLLAFITVAGGFVVMAVWDVKVPQKEVEKPIDTAKVLEKKT
jgi:hypothetical protein